MEFKIKIDKGVKYPKLLGNDYYDLFNQMEIGDSFFIKLSYQKGLETVAASILNRSRKFRFKNNPNFRIKTYIDRTENGIRAWRIE